MPLTLLLRFWKPIAGAALLAALVVAFLWYRNGLIQDGRRLERAVWQAKWDARETAMQKAANDQIQRNIVEEAARRARNEELAREHQKETAAAIADRDRYRGLFQRSREAASADSGQRPESPSVAGTDAATPTGSPEAVGTAAEYAAALDAAVADVMVESRQNASQLLRLQEEIRPQIKERDPAPTIP